VSTNSLNHFGSWSWNEQAGCNIWIFKH